MPTHTPTKWSCRNEESAILEVARAMIREKHMPNFYWADAASTTVYLMNRCTTNGVHELTPYEIVVVRKPFLLHLKVFRSIGNIRIQMSNREKPDAKLEKCILIGYSSAKKAYKCFNPLTRVVRVSRDVVFDESTSWYKPNPTSSNPIEEELNAITDVDIQPNPLPKESLARSTELNGVEYGCIMAVFTLSLGKSKLTLSL